MIRTIYHIIENVLIFLILFFTLALGGAKLIGHISPFMVLSGSMEPQLATGSLCFVNERDREAKAGDIIAFSKGSMKIVHRVLKAEHGVYTTKGDNNPHADRAPVSQKEVLGKVVFSIPKAGYAAAFLQTKKGMLLTSAALAAFFVMGRLLPERKKRGGGYEAG